VSGLVCLCCFFMSWAEGVVVVFCPDCFSFSLVFVPLFLYPGVAVPSQTCGNPPYPYLSWPSRSNSCSGARVAEAARRRRVWHVRRRRDKTCCPVGPACSRPLRGRVCLQVSSTQTGTTVVQPSSRALASPRCWAVTVIGSPGMDIVVVGQPKRLRGGKKKNANGTKPESRRRGAAGSRTRG